MPTQHCQPMEGRHLSDLRSARGLAADAPQELGVDGQHWQCCHQVLHPEEVVTVPYNTEVADRVRGVLSDRENMREVKMFGGLAFMVDERMIVCVSGGGLLVRVAPERDAEYLKRAGAERAEMGKGRSMGEGWIIVDEEALDKDEDLQYWMDASLAFHAQGSGKKGKASRK